MKSWPGKLNVTERQNGFGDPIFTWNVGDISVQTHPPEMVKVISKYVNIVAYIWLDTPDTTTILDEYGSVQHLHQPTPQAPELGMVSFPWN